MKELTKKLPQPQIKYKSVLDLGNGQKIRCYVLEDGTRILDEKDLENFFEMPMDELIKLAKKAKKD